MLHVNNGNRGFVDCAAGTAPNNVRTYVCVAF